MSPCPPYDRRPCPHCHTADCTSAVRRVGPYVCRINGTRVTTCQPAYTHQRDRERERVVFTYKDQPRGPTRPFDRSTAVVVVARFYLAHALDRRMPERPDADARFLCGEAPVQSPRTAAVAGVIR